MGYANRRTATGCIVRRGLHSPLGERKGDNKVPLEFGARKMHQKGNSGRTARCNKQGGEKAVEA
jgi:hypothetical protein